MKNLFYFLMLVLMGSSFSSCTGDDDDDDDNPQTTFIELSGNLSTQTLTADKKYLLKGQVFIQSGQTVTIQPGTVIFGDKLTKGTLVVNIGGKLNAEGTVDNPIIFTSNLPAGIRDRGDWGGLIILGKANVNQTKPAIEGITPEVNFGTTNSTEFDNDNSGILKYVRVEFAGIELTPNNETNSITLGGVGNGTIMENCMVSFGGDDGFEWFGGTVNGKNLISLATWDDDFDVDYGYSGNVQFGLVVRYPSFADQSGSNAFECDNGPNDNDVQPYTTGTFSNITVYGPISPESSSISANYQHAMDLRRRTAVTIANSVFTGFPRGLRFNQPSVTSQYTSNTGALLNNIMVIGTLQYQAGTGVTIDDVKNYWEANGNTTNSSVINVDILAGLGLKNNFYGKKLSVDYPSNPDFTLGQGSLSSGAKFDNAKFNEPKRKSFFQTPAFIGAFGGTDWTDGWAEFSPINKPY